MARKRFPIPSRGHFRRLGRLSASRPGSAPWMATGCRTAPPSILRSGWLIGPQAVAPPRGHNPVPVQACPPLRVSLQGSQQCLSPPSTGAPCRARSGMGRVHQLLRRRRLGHPAENATESLARRTRVTVTGRLEQRSWETPRASDPRWRSTPPTSPPARPGPRPRSQTTSAGPRPATMPRSTGLPSRATARSVPALWPGGCPPSARRSALSRSGLLAAIGLSTRRCHFPSRPEAPKSKAEADTPWHLRSSRSPAGRRPAPGQGPSF